MLRIRGLRIRPPAFSLQPQEKSKQELWGEKLLLSGEWVWSAYEFLISVLLPPWPKSLNDAHTITLQSSKGNKPGP
jgi:hypothetical protein